MISNMPCYAQMKDSGVEWLGEIPIGWEARKLKFVSDMFVSNVDKHSKKSEHPVRLCNYVDVYKNTFILPDIDFMQATANRTEIQKFAIKIGDVLITKDSEDWLDIGVPALVKYEAADLICGYHLAILRSKKGIYGSFLYWALLAQYNRTQLSLRANGVTRFGISHSAINDAWQILPSLPEQTAIATLLDQKTAQIKQAISLKQKQIELFKERKQLVVQQAVTKGLNPNAPMRDSGVEWIGEIPEHWIVKRLRVLGTTQNGISAGAEYFGTGFPFVSYGDVYNNRELPEEVKGLAMSPIEDRKQYSIQAGDILFTRTSETIQEIGFTSVCMKTIDNATFSGFLIRFRPAKNVIFKGFSKYYFSAAMHRSYFVKEMNLVTRASLSQELLKNLPVILPPLNEQEQIYSFIETQSAKIDKAIDIQQQQINKLKEYKATLINSAVTGKIKVA